MFWQVIIKVNRNSTNRLLGGGFAGNRTVFCRTAIDGVGWWNSLE